jgi:hypothetical protein
MSIDWKSLEQLASGQPVSTDVTPQTCALAELIVQSVKGGDKPEMELAMQLAIWRERFEEIRQEYDLPTDANSRKVMGFSDVQQLQAENQRLKMENHSLRYTMQSAGNKLLQAAKQSGE